MKHLDGPGVRPRLRIAILLSALASVLTLDSCRVSVRTYHYDNLRTGWNSAEKELNPSNVGSLNALVLALDDANDQVDAQPLIVPNLRIAGGKHEVVYVATENNNVYAIDGNTDSKLLKVNLGPAVAMPLGCGNNGPTVGINGTPVIDLHSKTMYVIAYVLDSSHGRAATPAYYLHALDLATLTDKSPPRLVSASHRLRNGTGFSFQAEFQRQRTGLLFANGNIYAGFGSFCDWGGAQSRGWILGWQAGTLTPLAANELNDTQTSEPNGMFLSSVWMSGYGIAGEPEGNIYFSTGNSDYSGTTYDGITDVQESVVKLGSNLTRPATPPPFLFTPSNVAALDQADLDVGSAGVMVLPAQAGPVAHMAVANAKDGRMFLLNRENMGGFTANNAGALDIQSTGSGCWCGPAYFNDGSPHIVSSGGNSVILWNLQTSPQPKLVSVASGTVPLAAQDPGFFTTVSSKGKANAIIWAVSRPPANSEIPTISLHAFNATPSGNTLPLLFEAVAGSWPYLGGNANIVPVVANGKVYVASYKELDIFGINLPGGHKAQSRKPELIEAEKAILPGLPGAHQISGTVTKLAGTHLTIQTRDGKLLEVDATRARNSFRYPPLTAGSKITAAGSYNSSDVLEAELVFRAKRAPMTWPPDR